MAGLTEANPLSLAIILDDLGLINGDEIILADGVYTYPSTLYVRKSVTLRPKHPYRAIIREIPDDQGAFFMKPGSAGCKLENLVIDRPGWTGINWWTPAAGSELYGCVIVNPAAGPEHRGYSIYEQNENVAFPKLARHCVFGQGNSYGVHAYGTADGAQAGYRFESCVNYGNFLVGGQPGVAYSDVLIDGCHILGNLYAGYLGRNHDRLTVTGNTIYSPGYYPLAMTGWRDMTITDNLLVSEGINRITTFVQPDNPDGASRTIDRNDYRSLAPMAAPFAWEGVGWYTLAEQRSLFGWDINSTVTTGLPAGNQVQVYPNERADGAALVVVWNWENNAQAEINVSTVFGDGENVTVSNCQDWTHQQLAVIDGYIIVSLSAGVLQSFMMYRGHPDGSRTDGRKCAADYLP